MDSDVIGQKRWSDEFRIQMSLVRRGGVIINNTVSEWEEEY